MRVVVVLLSVFLAFVLLLMALVGVVLFSPPGTFKGTPAKRAPNRNAVEALKFQHSDELLKLLGKPDRTSTGDDFGTDWHYHDKTIDPISGQPDRHLVIEVGPTGIVMRVRSR